MNDLDLAIPVVIIRKDTEGKFFAEAKYLKFYRDAMLLVKATAAEKVVPFPTFRECEEYANNFNKNMRGN